MLTAGNAAPDIEEIFALFHFRRRRRMVGADRCDIAEPVAKLALFIAGPKRRRTLGDRAELLHVLVREHQVMRTRLASHIDSFRSCLRHKGDARSTAHMNDVESTTGFRRNIDRATNRFELGSDWP